MALFFKSMVEHSKNATLPLGIALSRAKLNDKDSQAKDCLQLILLHPCKNYIFPLGLFFLFSSLVTPIFS